MSARDDLRKLAMWGDDRAADGMLDAYRAEVLREAADMIDAYGPTCQCSGCQTCRGNAAALRHEAKLVAGGDGSTTANEPVQPAPALCTCRRFPVVHRADLHDEQGLVRDITPVASGIWGALVHARCGRCGWQSPQRWLQEDFVKPPAQTVISHHRDEATGKCAAGSGAR